MSETIGALKPVKDEYDVTGWCRNPESLSIENVEKLRESIDRISRENRPEVVYEQGTNVVRAVHGCHLFDETSAKLVRLPLLVELAEALVGEPVYVYQFKVNLKQPYEGAAWPWHQDYTFWRHEDGMTDDRAVNIAILLDDTHEGNGPLRVLPGTHRLGLIEAAEDRSRSGDWRKHVSANLEYTVADADAERLEKEYGRELVVGAAGSIFAFHPSIVHSSSSNTSPDRRALLLVTYNAVSNAPGSSPRPEFLVSRDTRPVVPAEDNFL
ncbi:phytanoyl-CoA dioxygenase family protein [Micromonospora sp. CPCC 205561]|uniref:phytanoyl-CoA dioxygenase family protein n=1 Tax=Micromonospora sp. CPCC 205561 TaxID=3122407 RepID=UPI002FEF7E09